MIYFDVPESERKERCYLSEDLCVVDDARFFVRGCMEIPVIDHKDVLTIGAWAELERDDFLEYQELLEVEDRDVYGPYGGFLSAAIPTFEKTEGLELNIHIKNNAIRPDLVISSATHPLGSAQRIGLTLERVQAFYSYFERNRGGA